VLSFRLPVGGGRNSAPDRRAAFLDDVERQIRALPGVRSVGAISGLPMTGLGMGMTFADAGRPAPPPEARPIALSRVVTPQYFKAMGVRLLAGRWLNEQDSAGASPVAVVDEQVVRRLWPAASSPSAALDAEVMLDLRQGVRAKIAGVVANVKPERMDQADWPTIYSPYAQAADVASVMTVVTRTAGRPLAIAPAVERIVHSLDPEQPVADLREMEDVVDQSMAGARFHAVVLGVFAQLAFVLAAVGIYGVISYDVTQRTQEIGIRMALGAGKAQVVRLLLRQAAAMAGLGIALGLGLAFGLTRFMSAMLYGVKPVDAGTFATAAALLAAVALAASYLPARRALDLDPLVALKQE
jgi:putative ABC transport system permease protein